MLCWMTYRGIDWGEGREGKEMGGMEGEETGQDAKKIEEVSSCWVKK